MKNGYELETFDSAEPYSITLMQIKKFNLHWHNYIEVFYVKKGSIRLQTGDFSFHLDEGHICFIDSNTIHSVNRTDSDNLIMTLQIPIDKGRPFSMLKQYKFNSAGYLADFSKDLAPLDELRNLLENIYKESRMKVVGYNNVILGYINTFFGLLIRRYYLIEKQEEDYTAESNLNRLSEIIEYLDEHYVEKLTLKDLSVRLHMNYYYLSHFFKDTAGISFQDYLNNLRIDKSLSLLAETNSSITEISFNTGFPNIKAYTKAFQKKFGVLPSAYRKILASDQNGNINNEYIEKVYTEHMGNSYEEVSATDIYNKLSITPKDSRFFALDYYIGSNVSSEEISQNSKMVISKDVLSDIQLNSLSDIVKDLSLDRVKICAYSLSANEEQIFSQKLDLLTLSGYSLEDSVSGNRIMEPLPFPMALTMLGAISHTLEYLSAPLSVPASIIADVLVPEEFMPFNRANTYMTAFGCPSPYYYSDLFIHKLRGQLVFKSESCVVFLHNGIYRILCCHKKSYQMYQSLKTSSNFDRDEYLFFVKSYPHMRYSFSFGTVNSGFRQISYSLNEAAGSVFSNWIKMGSPSRLDKTLADYLVSVTKPDINITLPPFRDKPVISVELPPLGIAYLELHPIK